MSAPARAEAGAAPATHARLAAVFARARAEQRRALVIYLTASDPDDETFVAAALAAVRAGADVLEIGVPWTDPSADGAAIQAAMLRAIAAGGGLGRTLRLCARIREAAPEVGLVLFGYANPIVVTGLDTFARRARAAGADAALCVDWPADEDASLPAALRAEGLDFIPLLAPTSTDSRVRAALAVASGFIYYVSLTGTTGVKLTDFGGVRNAVERIRGLAPNPLPVAVGFGITTPDEARQVAAFADGVVVGSAAVRTLADAVRAGRDGPAALAAYVGALRAALTQPT